MLYAMSYLLGRIYRRRTRMHIEELAEAGLEIAARDALLREARLDLESVAAVGQRGRFTDQRLGSFMLGNILGRGYLAGFGLTIGTVYGRIAGREAARCALG